MNSMTYGTGSEKVSRLKSLTDWQAVETAAKITFDKVSRMLTMKPLQLPGVSALVRIVATDPTPPAGQQLPTPFGKSASIISWGVPCTRFGPWRFWERAEIFSVLSGAGGEGWQKSEYSNHPSNGESRWLRLGENG
jgi:hypothetical protein